MQNNLFVIKTLSNNDANIFAKIALRTSMGSSLYNLAPVNLKLFFELSSLTLGSRNSFFCISCVVFHHIKITLKVITHVTIYTAKNLYAGATLLKSFYR